MKAYTILRILLSLKMHKNCYLYVTIIVFTGCVIGQNITIFDHRQEDSKTVCENGLISDVDTVVFKCEINYSQDKSIKYAHFYLQKETDEVPLFYSDLNIQECISSDKVTCERTDVFVIHTSISVPASNAYNGAVISAKLLKSNGMEVPSNKMSFPEIIKIENANTSASMFINGKEISTNLTTCLINVIESNLNITFVCQSFLKPCLIEIRAHGIGSTSNGENNVTLFLEQIPEDLYVLIQYASCTFKYKYNGINCTIHTVKTENAMNTAVTIAGSVVAAAIVIILLTVAVIKRRKIKTVFLKIKYKETKSPDTADGAIQQQIPFVPKNIIQTYRSTYLREIECSKNPDHSEFYAINDFVLEHIHKDLRDTKILKLITLIANLTTRICVEFISKERPNSDLKVKGMVLKYAISNKKDPRYKTGMVIDFIENQNNKSTCSCKNCQRSTNQRKQLYSLYVLTSSTVVYDDSEAEKSSFDLFYDTSESQVTTLHGTRVHKINRKEGWCVVECVTCDLTIIEKLSSMIKNCRDQMKKVNIKYNVPNHTRSFTFIVSHPHGSTKHITFGFWKDRKTVSKKGKIFRRRYTYTTPTCPGSAGAFVYILGVSNINKEIYHVHISYKAERCNYCSIGAERLP